ncbi:hypothetical protein GMJLKIPL_2639 [Methylobacterium isbiliense]|jgi:hypothetical protein|uniref:Uncharacterized protein n=1 Tax=Methylobacterium isbiliense TaxID=315478 RepID=A0ABQ4SFM2_9HYPH|nr:hypothetical protein GMJLKIPL_2639 [Methylobacterium isbiliense]
MGDRAGDGGPVSRSRPASGWADRAVFALAAALTALPCAAAEKGAAAKSGPPVVTCGSLANLRMLLRDTKGEAAAIARLFADPKADHLGCAATPRDRLGGVADHVVVGGTGYDCLTVKDSTVCRWAEPAK